ncbi:Protein kinase domain [Carpediemonas membranifera]|uniref:dual-specificity kinase n=1 Tax=Carpediemonas membranifera TaxID=201153 RepID=A0A8J6B6N8_9EUKA|nr:Protein kinase domain [Carpediemonas membranifera]|eukprot:KAG9391107.1 Protein kinase domain [Carpediemonas membranifera]
MAPISPAACLKTNQAQLTHYEQSEIFQYPAIYYWGAGAHKIQGSPAQASNAGYDDDRGDYKFVLHDHFSYRYEVLNMLGRGSFGQVAKVYDYKTNKVVALKVIRNKKRFHHQGLIEVKILDYLRDHDPNDTTNIVRTYESFYFRNHLCVTFELLSVNLYEFMKSNNFQSLSLALIRKFAIQLLNALRYQYQHRIVHCDLKPENILLKHPLKSGIKVIDFGSSCFENEKIYTYIQSRFYRSPEIILGGDYGLPIDMWSLGCILAELYTGYPLFPGENEAEQLACIMEVMGVPPHHVISNASRRKLFFDGQNQPLPVVNSRGRKRRPGTKDLATALRCNDKDFLSFLAGCLEWDPHTRFTPDQALAHPWIMDAMMMLSTPSKQPAPKQEPAKAVTELPGPVKPTSERRARPRQPQTLHPAQKAQHSTKPAPPKPTSRHWRIEKTGRWGGAAVGVGTPKTGSTANLGPVAMTDKTKPRTVFLPTKPKEPHARVQPYPRKSLFFRDSTADSSAGPATAAVPKPRTGGNLPAIDAASRHPRGGIGFPPVTQRNRLYSHFFS